MIQPFNLPSRIWWNHWNLKIKFNYLTSMKGACNSHCYAYVYVSEQVIRSFPFYVFHFFPLPQPELYQIWIWLTLHVSDKKQELLTSGKHMGVSGGFIIFFVGFFFFFSSFLLCRMLSVSVLCIIELLIVASVFSIVSYNTFIRILPNMSTAYLSQLFTDS